MNNWVPLLQSFSHYIIYSDITLYFIYFIFEPSLIVLVAIVRMATVPGSWAPRSSVQRSLRQVDSWEKAALTIIPLSRSQNRVSRGGSHSGCNQLDCGRIRMQLSLPFCTWHHVLVALSVRQAVPAGLSEPAWQRWQVMTDCPTPPA